MGFNFKNMGAAIVNRGVMPAAGGAGAAFVNKVVPNMNPKLRSALKIGIGALIPEFIGGGKNKMIDAIGSGFSGAAGFELANSFIPSLSESSQPVSGIGADAEFITDNDFVQGTDDIISGDDEIIIEGMDSPISGIGSDDENMEKLKEADIF